MLKHVAPPQDAGRTDGFPLISEPQVSWNFLPSTAWSEQVHGCCTFYGVEIFWDENSKIAADAVKSASVCNKHKGLPGPCG